MIVTTFRLDGFDYEGSNRRGPFFDCFLDEFEDTFFFATVDAEVFFKRVFKLWERYLRPIEAGNCRLARIGRGYYCRPCELLSSGW
jgi:hypothetical protein